MFAEINQNGVKIRDCDPPPFPKVKKEEGIYPNIGLLFININVSCEGILLTMISFFCLF